MKPRAIVSVINDLVTDQRVSRTCNTLQEAGFEVLLVGRKLPESRPINRPYATKRMRLLFRKKAIFYAEMNLRLFLLLLFRKANLLIANDIDTALANYWIHRIKKVPLIIDCHEYFCGVPELLGRERTIRFWKKIERQTLPKADRVITVNESLAKVFGDEYNIEVSVVRNVPVRLPQPMPPTEPPLPLPYIIYQGAVNVDRGLEEMVAAMEYLPDYHLVIAGTGDLFPTLQQTIEGLNYRHRIHLLGALAPDILRNYTRHALLGISIEKDTCFNYHYCLPNKLFDYIQAEIPVIVSDLPEMRRIVEQYHIGGIVAQHDPKTLSEAVKNLCENEAERNLCRSNAARAAATLCWQNESQTLKRLFLPYLN